MMARPVARKVSSGAILNLLCSVLLTHNSKAIESRVARIKARVAELTGNMDSSANGRR